MATAIYNGIEIENTEQKTAMPPIHRYQLLIATNDDEEENVYANLTDEQVEKIKQDMRGEIMSEHLVMLENGEMIDTGIIDNIQRDENSKSAIEQYADKQKANKASSKEQER